MRIVYIGSVDFSYHCLKIVLNFPSEVVGIATGRKANYNSDYADLTPLANQYGIPIHYFRNVNDAETVRWVRHLTPDIVFCWGISQMIRSELLAVPPMGIVGSHPALLPLNRGRHPLIWALVLGLKESGLTFFFLDEGADSGPILSQRKFRIGPSDDATTLYQKIKESADVQIPEFLPRLISGNYQAVDQNHNQANYWRKRSPKDGTIDWRMTSRAILALIRALAKPYPGAELRYNGQKITIWKAERLETRVPKNLEPGRVIAVDEGRVIIKCYDGAVVINDYEPRVEFIPGHCLE